MKKLIAVLSVFVLVTPLFCYEAPIFYVNDINAGTGYTVKDFYVYNYSTSYLKAYVRLYYSGTSYRQFVKLTVSLYKNTTLVGTKDSYADYETYGNSGMIPGAETYLYYYLDKVDFNRVGFNVSYSASSGNEQRFNKNAIVVTNSAISPFSGSTKKISGIVKNLSASALKFPNVFICLYKGGRVMQYQMTFADVSNNSLSALQTATFYTYMDLPDSYDSIKYFPNYSLTLTGPVIISDVADYSKQTMPYVFSIAQNYPNPFNSCTTIDFSIDQTQPIKLELFDRIGKSVMMIFCGTTYPGWHSITIDAASLASGTYFCALSGESKLLFRKLTIIK